MQPFSIKTLELLIIAALSFLLTFYTFDEKEGFAFIFLRSFTFCILFAVPFYFRNISPDLKQVIETIKKKFS